MAKPKQVPKSPENPRQGRAANAKGGCLDTAKPPKKAPKRPPKGTNPVGRPPKYKTPQELQAKIDEYFEKCAAGETITRFDNKRKTVETVKRRIPCLIVGLALHLGFANRDALNEYKGKTDEFSMIVSRAKARCEQDMASGAIQGDYDAKTSSLILSATHGYVTKSQIDLGNRMEDALRALDEKSQSGGKS